MKSRFFKKLFIFASKFFFTRSNQLAEKERDIMADQPIKTELQDFDVDQFRDQTTETFEKYKNVIFGALLAVVLIGGGYYFYSDFYMKPRNENANKAIFQAEAMFQKDSFLLALNGTGAALAGQMGGSYEGFLDIIANYSGTDAANRAHYGAGASLLRLGKAEEAIKYLEAYNGKDGYSQAAAYALLGDAYSETNDNEQALSYYEQAAKESPNAMMTPIYMRKAALFNEVVMNNASRALELYKEIEQKYPEAAERLNISKDVVRLEQGK
ncbi:tetratricopeptide domain protein [Saprospira grandis str. Lewin]|uniref:Tetratricopeptide domain protein n=2 Tax=Saprospira TaxID=1007 RepID=H6L813_SAPGL|nr:tetratricopeptide domain protein [Saprospira grandis str. Lewin]